MESCMIRRRVWVESMCMIRRRVWVESMGVTSRYSCKEVAI